MMIRLKLYLLLFFIAVSIPLSFVIWRTYAGVAREEQAQLRYFAQTLFDDMEKELGELVRREENRAVDAYGAAQGHGVNGGDPSPLSRPAQEAYILGYLQNDPDGQMQTPLAAETVRPPERYQPIVDALQEVNRIFNRKKWALPGTPLPAAPALRAEQEAPVQTSSESFMERYRAPAKRKAAKSYLGRQEVRTEEISRRQVANLTPKKEQQWLASDERAERQVREADAAAGQAVFEDVDRARPAGGPIGERSAAPASLEDKQRFQAEVAPLQSVFIDPERIFIFRRVVINDRIFRQGFVLMVAPLLNHLAATYFDPHPLADFTRLSLMIMDSGGHSEVVRSGAAQAARRTVVERTFPAPFNFVSAAVLGENAPPSPARRTLNVALAVLGGVLLIGFWAIYQSVRSVVELSERRSQFVSSVTHELKTPLTNIRMYVEMLEQGIAATPEREHDYLGIVASESGRLSRLINNVLELAKLEKRQRHMDLQPGCLDDVLAEVRAVMSPKLAREGFELRVRDEKAPWFAYDREAMIQILINLMENSIKFGRHAEIRRITIAVAEADGRAVVTVTDTGPGIPKAALKRVFDDFYRAHNALTRTTGGTGIGLALVKKLVAAMGGQVQAANNDGPGCTITIRLPLRVRAK